MAIIIGSIYLIYWGECGGDDWEKNCGALRRPAAGSYSLFNYLAFTSFAYSTYVTIGYILFYFILFFGWKK